MAESLVAVSPLSKRCRLEISSSEEESDLPEAIFPSDEEDFNTSLESCKAFYPSEESNLEPLKVMEFASFTQNSPLKWQNIADKDDSEDHELGKIGRLLVGTCCDKLCNLTATDIISTKVDYVSLTRSDQRLYLFNKIKESSCESAGKVTTNFFYSGEGNLCKCLVKDLQCFIVHIV